MALTTADVYSPQVPGLAQVLGSGLGSLRILQQEGYRRAREAAAKAKAAAELEKQFTPPAPDTDGGQVFAPQIAQNTKALLSFAQDKYKEAVQGSITPNDAKALVAQKLAETNTTTKRAKDSQAAIDKFKAEARANNLDVSKVGGFVNMATTDPATGQTMDINQFDPEALTQGVTNADVIDKAGAVQNFLKGLAGKQESDYSTAARLGGTGITRSASSNIFASDAQGRTIYTLDAQGNRVPKIANLRALEQAALQDPQMAALLRRSLEQGQKPTATALMGIGGEHVTDDQLEALNAQTDQNTGLERQSLADLLRPYGTLVQKQKETYLAPRAPRASAGSKQAAHIEATDGSFDAPGTYNATVERSASGVAVQPGNTKVDVRATNPGTTQEGFAHYGKGAAPKIVKKDGTRVDTEAKNLLVNGFYQEDGQGHFNYVADNKTPLAGGYGEPFKILVDSKTKRLHQLAPGESAETLIRNGKAEYATHLNVYAHKNENYTADLGKLTDELMQEKNSNDEPKYQSRARAELVAKDALEKGRSRKLVPYAENAVTIDNDTRTPQGKGYYKPFEQRVQAENARIRSSAPRNRPNPLGFGAPKAAASAAPKLKTVGKNNALGF